MNKPFALRTHRIVIVALSLLLASGAAVGVFASQDAGGIFSGSSAFSNGTDALSHGDGCVKLTKTPPATSMTTTTGTATATTTGTPKPVCTPKPPKTPHADDDDDDDGCRAARTPKATKTPDGTHTPKATKTPKPTCTATPTGTITPAPTACIDNDDDDGHANDTHLDEDTDDGVENDDTHLDEDDEDCEDDNDDIHGIPDANPSHEPNDDGDCEKGETEIKTTPSGTQVNIPCHAADGGGSGNSGPDDDVDD